jgi:hypothetical protein
MEPKETWKQWRREVEHEALDIEAAALALDIITIAQTTGLGGLGSHGQAHLDRAIAVLCAEQAGCVRRIHVAAAARRDVAKIAKWLQDALDTWLAKHQPRPSWEIDYGTKIVGWEADSAALDAEGGS